MVKKNKQKKKSEEKVDLELRPHHVLGYIGHEAQPELYSLSDNKYISNFREAKRKEAEEAGKQQGWSEEDIKKAGESAYNFHSDKLILHWRDSIKRIHDNPDTKFKYVSSSDSVCKGCDKKEGCHDENHWTYKVVQQADTDAHNWMSMLEHGKLYTGHDLKKLVKKYKNLLKEHK